MFLVVFFSLIYNIDKGENRFVQHYLLIGGITFIESPFGLMQADDLFIGPTLLGCRK